MLKVAHLVNYAPGLSGMYGTVRDLVLAERKREIQAEVVDDVGGRKILPESVHDGIVPVNALYAEECDIICWHHAMHWEWYNQPHRNLVLFLHGTPEFNLGTELYGNENTLSFLIGLVNMGLVRRTICMWERHLPFWENLFNKKVDYVPIWADVASWEVSKKKVDKEVIKIGLVDFWRITREPLGLFTAIDILRREGKKIEVDVWGLTDAPNDTYKAVLRWLYEYDIVNIKGNTTNVQEDIYHQCDVILSMSSEETRVVRESQSCGVPVVIGRNVPGFTKYRADCTNARALAKQILRAHGDLCADTDSLRKSIRKSAEKRYDVTAASKRIINIFREVVDEHGSPNNPKIITWGNGLRKVETIGRTCSTLRKSLTPGHKDEKAICYLRFGDGDLVLINGEEGESFHKNSSELSQELIDAFTHKDEGYYVACVAGMLNEKRMQTGLFARFGYDDTLQEIAGKLRKDETLGNPIALAYQFVFENEWFYDFIIECVYPKKVLFIGPEGGQVNPLLKAIFKWSNYIEVPERDAYYALDELDKEEGFETKTLWNHIEEEAKEHELIVCAAGMATRVIAKRLWKEKGIKTAFIDIGSIVDCILEKETRTWVRMVKDNLLPVYRNYFLKTKTDIIVLTHKHEEKTIKCFESIKQHTSNYRVIWVDNGSGDASVAKVVPVAKTLEDCDIIRLPENKGFSVGVNNGLIKSIQDKTADFIVLLNNDTVVSHGWLERLQLALKENNLDAVSPVTSSDNPHSADALRQVRKDMPVLGNSIEHCADVLWKKYGREVLVVDNMVSFFCVLMPFEVVTQTGLLDENIFAYGEDNDYCTRLRLLGKSIGIALGTYIHHDHGITSDGFGEKWKEEQRNKAKDYLLTKYARAS